MKPFAAPPVLWQVGSFANENDRYLIPETIQIPAVMTRTAQNVFARQV
jgi:hypothetical protein